MPENGGVKGQIPYRVTFPDGHVQTFTGPSWMTDVQVYGRAVQERKFTEGSIPTTFAAGAAPEAAQALTTAGLSAAGYASGQPAIVGLAPGAGRLARAAAEKLTGQDVTPTSTAEVATLAAQGLIPAAAPSIVSGIAGPVAQAVSKLPVSTLPQALARGAVPAVQAVATEAEAISPQAVGGIISSLINAAHRTGARVIAGISTDDLMLLRESIAKGMAPRVAAKVVSGGDPTKAASLLRIMRMP